MFVMQERTFKKISFIVLFLVGAVTVFLGYQIQFIRFDYNFEEFFPAKDEESTFFFDHRKKFESDNDFLLVAIENEASVFSMEFLQNVDSLCKQIEALPNVQFVQSITNSKERFLYPGGISSEVNYWSRDVIKLPSDSARIYKNQELVRSLISENAKSLAIFIRHEDYLSKEKSEALVSDVNELLAGFKFDKTRMAGRTAGQIFYIDTMIGEMATYISLSLFLIVLFLYIAFRSLWGIIVPQLVIVGSMIWIVGFMSWIGEPINILLVILPSIMFVVAMSDVIHLVSKYIELLRDGAPKYEAIKIAFKEIGLATLLTSITTSIGFFSLAFVNVIPIQVFGWYTGVGVIFAFILTFATLPFLFYYTKTPALIRKQKKNYWLPILRKSFLFTLHNRKWLPIFSVVLILGFGWGISKIVSNNFILDDIRENVEMKQNFNFFDENYGGVRPFELAVTLKDTNASFFSVNHLKELEKVERFLIESYGVSIRASLVRAIQVMNRSAHSGNPEFFNVPERSKDVRKYKRALKIAGQGKMLRSILDSSQTVTRISGTIPDWGNLKTKSKNRALEQFIDENIQTGWFSFDITGSAHLLDKNMSYMSTSLVQGLTFALLVVAVLMGFLFRSFKMVVISMIPNLIPLILIAGIMGYFGIYLKITTAIVFTIAFGIAVDDTIHFLSKFKLELNKGKSTIYALKRTYLSTGKAIVLTSAILCSGFLLLLLSDFMGTFYMGLMVGITLVFAVLADLFLLPLLLLAFYGKRRK